MRLPGAARVVVSEPKVREYLLSRTHPSGRHKAAWLIAHGFTPDDWKVLEEALRLHAATHEVASDEESPFGRRYVLEGSLVTPDGRNPLARSVWFVETGAEVSQFITVYPLRGRG
jgi:hypothetical protein